MDTFSTNAAGGLDPSFANNGIFTFSQDIYGAFVVGGIAPGPDEGFLIAGRGESATEGKDLYAISRLTANGQPVPGFGENGMLIRRFKPDAASFAGVTALTQDGKLLVSGYYHVRPSLERKPALVRHLITGEIDTGFGEEGAVFFDFPPPKVSEFETNPAGGPPDTPYEYFSFRITPLPDGKILFSGVIESQRDISDSRYSVLGRLNPDGSLDQTFATQGYLYPKPPRNIVEQHLVLPDGNILLAGQMENVPGHRGYVARYLPSGELDRTFGSAGYCFIDGLTGGHLTALARYGDNGLMVGANQYFGGSRPWNGLLVGLTTEGDRDPDFNGGNPVEVKLGSSGFRLILKDLIIDGDGIVLLGDMGNIAVARYWLDGSPDVNFGDRSGWQEYPGNESYDLLRQPDGKFLATAMSTSGEKIVARFLNQ